MCLCDSDSLEKTELPGFGKWHCTNFQGTVARSRAGPWTLAQGFKDPALLPSSSSITTVSVFPLDFPRSHRDPIPSAGRVEGRHLLQRVCMAASSSGCFGSFLAPSYLLSPSALTRAAYLQISHANRRNSHFMPRGYPPLKVTKAIKEKPSCPGLWTPNLACFGQISRCCSF